MIITATLRIRFYCCLPPQNLLRSREQPLNHITRNSAFIVISHLRICCAGEQLLNHTTRNSAFVNNYERFNPTKPKFQDQLRQISHEKYGQ